MSRPTRKILVGILAVILSLGLVSGVVGAASKKDVLLQRLSVVYDVVAAMHKDGADLDKFMAGAIKGGLDTLNDPYTQHYTDTEFADFMDTLNASFTGIGAYLDLEGSYVIITSTVKDSPAAKAGLAPRDRVLEVNGVSMVGATLEKVRNAVRGEAGSAVTLKLERPTENRTFSVTIVRAVINIPEVEHDMLDAEVGYIRLTSFGDDAASGFFKAVEELKAKGAKSLVLDLRGNPGGYLDSAVEIASAFVPKGQPVVWEVGKSGKQALNSTGRLINLPTTVLVDDGSASASEVLAGALQDYGAGTLVGTKTFGKGTVQQIFRLKIGGGMKVTVAEYLTAKERHVDKVGLTPDVAAEPFRLPDDISGAFALKRALSAPDVGLDVLAMQNRLALLGYETDRDGFFGVRTSDAVRKFAAANGLTSGGLVDNRFAEVLNQQVAAYAQEAMKADPQLKKALEIARGKILR